MRDPRPPSAASPHAKCRTPASSGDEAPSAGKQPALTAKGLPAPRPHWPRHRVHESRCSRKPADRQQLLSKALSPYSCRWRVLACAQSWGCRIYARGSQGHRTHRAPRARRPAPGCTSCMCISAGSSAARKRGHGTVVAWSWLSRGWKQMSWRDADGWGTSLWDPIPTAFLHLLALCNMLGAVW